MQMEVTSDLDQEPDAEDVIAKGYHEVARRRVEIKYEEAVDGIDVTFTYYVDGEQVTEEGTFMGVEDGKIHGGFWNGLTVEEFIENHFDADPEAEVGEIFDDVVNQNN